MFTLNINNPGKMTQFSENLRLMRKTWRFSQDEIGQKLGLNRGTVYTYESGQVQPSVDLVFRLARMAGVTVERLYLAKLTKEELPNYPNTDAEGGFLFQSAGGTTPETPLISFRIDVDGLLRRLQVLEERLDALEDKV
ncbi:MAG: helix-turn-helix protein [Bacteroidota bacterium]|jgi:DNA-binding XRE family transcriptional regulator